MSDRAKELAPGWLVSLGRVGRSGLDPRALAIDRPTALGTSARGNPGEARLLRTARATKATSTAPVLVRADWFTTPSSRTRPRGPPRTGSSSVTAPLGPRPAPGSRWR